MAPTKEWSLERNSVKAAVIFTKMMTEPSSLVLWALIPPQVDISKAEVPVEHDQKSVLTVVLDLALTELMKRLKLLIYTYWDHFSLSLSLYIYYTHITNHVVHPKWMLNVNYISIKNNILKRKVSNTEQIILKLNMFGTSLVAQWLRPSAFNSGGTGSIPGWILMMHCESENFW